MDGNAGRDGGTDRHDRYVFCYCFFFLLSSFLLLTFTISFVANYSNRRGGAEWDGTGRDNTGRGRAGWGAGGREEEVGEGRKAGWRGTWGQMRRRGG